MEALSTFGVIKLPSRTIPALATQKLCSLAERFEEAMKREATFLGTTVSSTWEYWPIADIDTALPADLLTYFVYDMNDLPAPDIGQVLMEGRANLILALSMRDLPANTDRLHFPLVMKRGDSPFFLPPPMEDLEPDKTTKSFFQMHDLHWCTRTNFLSLLTDLLRRRER